MVDLYALEVLLKLMVVGEQTTVSVERVKEAWGLEGVHWPKISGVRAHSITTLKSSFRIRFIL